MCLTIVADIRLFDIMTSSGFVYLHKNRVTAWIFGCTKIWNLNVWRFTAIHTTVSHSTQKKAEKLPKSLIPSIQSLADIQQCSASIDMWIDDYKHKSYMTPTLHFTDENWKLLNKVLFTCEFPDKCKTASNTWMKLRHKLVKLGLKVDMLSKLIFYLMKVLISCASFSSVSDQTAIPIRSTPY